MSDQLAAMVDALSAKLDLRQAKIEAFDSISRRYDAHEQISFGAHLAEAKELLEWLQKGE
jgi:ubiquinone/menaquinone biosynthesis C-methylase UbiE